MRYRRVGRFVGRKVLLLAVLPLLPPAVSFAEPEERTVTVLFADRPVVVEKALVEGDQLWIPADRIPAVNGFDLEPEGLCAGELCIPIDRETWVLERGEVTYLSVTRIADRLEQVWVADPRRGIWSFGEVPVRRSGGTAGRIAPDFTLPDRAGEPVSLSSFRGRKVLLLTWASW